MSHGRSTTHGRCISRNAFWPGNGIGTRPTVVVLVVVVVIFNRPEPPRKNGQIQSLVGDPMTVCIVSEGFFHMFKAALTWFGDPGPPAMSFGPLAMASP
jgi:hypothetical protein